MPRKRFLWKRGAKFENKWEWQEADKELLDAPIRTKKDLPAPKGIGVQGINSESKEPTQFYLMPSKNLTSLKAELNSPTLLPVASKIKIKA